MLQSIAVRREVSLSSPRLLAISGWAGFGLFLAFNLVVLALVIHDPLARSVVPIYRHASLGWWQGRDIFGDGGDGFIYLPTFAVLYTPFALLGHRLGDSVWRVFSDAILVFSVWRALSLAIPAVDRRKRLLVLGAVLLVALPCSFGALRNGQATTLLYALMLLGSVDIARERWWSASAMLALALIVKPLAIVLLLLVAVLYPKLSWRLAIALAILLVIPLINPDPMGAFHLYGLGLRKILVASDAGAGRWADIAGFLSRLGLDIPMPVMTGVRLVMAFATLMVAFAARRNGSRIDGALNILALSVVYLMLMNPRTEGNTYLVLGFTIGLMLAVVVHREGDQRTGLVLTGLSIAYMFAVAIPPDALIRPQPLLCLIFTPFLVRRCLARFPAEHPAAGAMSLDASSSGAMSSG